MAVVMVIIHIAVLLHQIYTSVALPRAYPHFKDVNIELRQISCLDSGQCLPEEFRNVSVPADAVNCTDGVCSCSSCFTVTGGTCTLRQCWRFENGSCVDGRTRSQLTATLLSAFLSSVGAANFYIGRNDLAAGQLLLFLILVVTIAIGNTVSCVCRTTSDKDSEETDECIAELCCSCCCRDCSPDDSSEGILTACCIILSCGISVSVIVLAVLPVIAWWIADLVIFATNQRVDENGCPLF